LRHGIQRDELRVHGSGNNIKIVGEEEGQGKWLLCDNLLCGKGGLNETRKIFQKGGKIL
jgi:hypothetical protein